jgi:uncharacterized membrane protein YoaK (UPF0700 family)
MDPAGARREPIPVAVCLAFVAGFADASSFVGAGGIFCAHVTGNFVVLAADLARHAHADEWLKLATFPLFVLAVLAATRLHRRPAPGPGARAPRLLLALMSALFGVAAALAVALPRTAVGWSRPAIVTCLVIAMGVQNAMHRLNPSLGPMTTVMTGNVTQWFMEKLLPVAPEAKPKHRLLGVVIAAFAGGCIAGALGVARVGFVVLLVPTAVALFVRSRLR